MTNILKSTLLLLFTVVFFASCSDDNGSNPILKSPTTFHLNTPALATNGVYDLANSSVVELTCTQPDYGFPAVTKYTVQVATKQDMSDSINLPTTYTTAKIQINALDLASNLTTMKLAQGLTEQDFPVDMPVYLRLKANQLTADGTTIPGMEILSNVVTLKDVHLLFSLPPVKLPTHIYVTGSFNGWSWDTALDMVPVYGTDGIFWHLVYIDNSGIKFNTATAWDGGEVGFAKITVDDASELKSQIVDGGGNIASNTPGWYLMVVQCTLDGRNIRYKVTFNKPNVYIMGPVTVKGDWSELEDAALMTVPTDANGQFVSPAFSKSVPGGTGDGVRAYVKVPGFDWWKAEFMISSGKIVYRGKGGDQDRVAGTAGQSLYLNFTNETGEIK